MAEGRASKREPDECGVFKVDALDQSYDQEKLECAVCLQSCVHPVRLPCGHIFCYLCVKGVAHQSKRCAMCRKEIPAGYLERPLLVSTTSVSGDTGTSTSLQESCTSFADGLQWFYEGHNGWWQYDERTSGELEASFNRAEPTCELLIAGFLYVIDFGTMVQYRRNDPSRRRRIKRDLATIPKKGIAGLRFFSDPQQSEETSAGVAIAAPLPEIDRDRDGADGNEEDRELLTATTSNANIQTLSNMRFIRSAQSPSPVPTAPNNTPQTPHTPSQDSGTSSPTIPNDPSLQEIVQEVSSLFLDSIEDSDTDDEGGWTEQRPCPENLSDANDEIL